MRSGEREKRTRPKSPTTVSFNLTLLAWQDRYKILDDPRLKILNPPECDRTYSSVFERSACGTGYAQSMIDSPRSWSAGTNRAGQWMRIDAGSKWPVYGVQVQTRCCSPNGQRVTAFTIQHSTDDSTWSAVDGGVTFTHAFTGASGTFDARFAAAPVMAQYVRITVVSWVGHISMRAGLIMASQVAPSQVDALYYTDTPLQVAQPLSHS